MSTPEMKAIREHAERVVSRTRWLDELRTHLAAATRLADDLKGAKMVNALIQHRDLRITVRVNIGLVIAQLENDIRKASLWLRDNAGGR